MPGIYQATRVMVCFDSGSKRIGMRHTRLIFVASAATIAIVSFQLGRMSAPAMVDRVDANDSIAPFIEQETFGERQAGVFLNDRPRSDTSGQAPEKPK